MKTQELKPGVSIAMKGPSGTLVVECGLDGIPRSRAALKGEVE